MWSIYIFFIPGRPSPGCFHEREWPSARGAAEAGRFFAGQIGRIVSLLTEAEQSGHSEHFAPVHLAQPLASGVLLRARITGATNDTLLAEAA